MTNSSALRTACGASREKLWVFVPALLCLAFAGCSTRGSALNNNIVRDNGKVYSYKTGVVHCNDGRKIPYHPTDYEKEVGFSLPAICDYH